MAVRADRNGVRRGRIALIAYAYVRQKQVEEAVARGGYAAFNLRVSLIFAAVGIILGLGTIIIILAESS